MHGKIAEFLPQRSEAGEAVNVKRGLAVFGLRQFILGPLECDPAERPSQDFIRPFEKLRRDRMAPAQVKAHADGLCALAREKQRDSFGHTDR